MNLDNHYTKCRTFHIIIPYSQIASGDVIAWDTIKYENGTRIIHVVLYIGNGMMVKASSTHDAVVKESVLEYEMFGCKITSLH